VGASVDRVWCALRDRRDARGGRTRKGGLQSRGKSETAPVDRVGKCRGSTTVLALCFEGHGKTASECFSDF